MEATVLPNLRLRFPQHLCSFKSVRITKGFKIAAHGNLENGPSSFAEKKVLRREIIRLVGFTPIFANVYAIRAAPVPDMKEPDVIRTLKLASGVKLQDIVEGQGKEARQGDLVEFNYVCRRSNGYFVHSTVDQFSGESSPVILPLNDEQMIRGLKEVLIGMKTGGKRRALIPPSLGYVSEDLQPIPEEPSVACKRAIDFRSATLESSVRNILSICSTRRTTVVENMFTRTTRL